MKNRTWTGWLVGLALLATAAVTAVPQERASLEERVRVELVLLDVIALDRQGRPVTDLTVDDFVVLENKRPVAIQSFDKTDVTAAAVAVPQQAAAGAADAAQPAAGTAPAPAPGPLRFILAIDLEFARMPEVQRSFRQIETFLEETARRPNVEWLVYGLERGELTEGFEPDTGRVLNALKRYEREYLDGRVEAGRADVRGTGRPLGSDELRELEARFQHCLDTSRHPQGCILDELDAFVDLLTVRTERAIDELSSLAGRFPDASSINTILFVSPGFSLRPGQAAMAMAGRYMRGRETQQPMQTESPRDAFLTAPPRTAESFEERFLEVVHECVRNRVVFHTFDVHTFKLASRRQADPEFGFAPSGLMTVYRDHADELAGGLRELADESGGQFFSGPTLRRMEDVLDRMAFVYTLGYPSPAGESGEFRKIKVKCKRKKVKLLHRSGYYAR